MEIVSKEDFKKKYATLLILLDKTEDLETKKKIKEEIDNLRKNRLNGKYEEELEMIKKRRC